MNRAELTDAIRDRLGVDKRAAETAVDAVFDTILRAVAQGEKVALSGFGVFEKVDRAARTGRNPRTGETVHVRPKRLAFFKVGKELRERVNSGRRGPSSSGEIPPAAPAAGSEPMAGSGTAVG